jgi:cell division transport system permease protein
MSKSPFKTTRGSWSAAFSTVVGITLTLCLLGVLSLIAMKGNAWKNQLKESMTVQVFLENDLPKEEIERVKKWLEAETFTKDAAYITQEEASAMMEKELGESFVDFLGYYPIPPSIDLKIHSNYSSLDSMEWIEAKLLEVRGIEEVDYQRVLLERIEERLQKITIPLLVVAGLLLFIAIALINNTIRLSIFSKRFLIKSMQLVGATRRFIRRPFIWQGIWFGLISGLLAFSILMGALIFLQQENPEAFEQTDLITFVQLFGIVVLLGILISWISTYFAVNKYIRLRQDQLY